MHPVHRRILASSSSYLTSLQPLDVCLSNICELDTVLLQLTVGTMDAGYRFIGCSKYNAKTIKDPKEMRVGKEKVGVNKTDTHVNHPLLHTRTHLVG